MGQHIEILKAKFPDLIKEEDVAKADEEFAVIVYVKGKNDFGKPFYAFIAVPPTKLEEVKAKQGNGQKLNLNDYEIICYGSRETPPPEVIEDMKKEYDVDLGFEKKAVDVFKNFLEKYKKPDKKEG